MCDIVNSLIVKTLFFIYYLYRQYLCCKALFQEGSIMSCWCVRLYPGHRTPRKSLILDSIYRVEISLPAALRLLLVLIIPNLLLLLCCVNEAKLKISVIWLKMKSIFCLAPKRYFRFKPCFLFPVRNFQHLRLLHIPYRFFFHKAQSNFTSDRTLTKQQTEARSVAWPVRQKQWRRR